MDRRKVRLSFKPAARSTLAETPQLRLILRKRPIRRLGKPRPKLWRLLPRVRFSLQTLLALILFCGFAALLWRDRDPWRQIAELQGSGGRFCFSPDESYIVAGYALYRFAGKRTPVKICELPLRGPIAFSPDGTMLAGGAPDARGIEIWGVAKGVRLISIGTKDQEQTRATFSPDSQWILVANGSESVAIRDIAGRLLSEFKTPALTGPRVCVESPRLRAALLSPDKALVLGIDQRCCFGSRYLWLWNRSSGVVLPGWPIKVDGFNGITCRSGFARDGRWIIDIVGGEERVYGLDGGQATVATPVEKAQPLYCDTQSESMYDGSMAACPCGAHCLLESDGTLALHQRCRPDDQTLVCLPAFWLALICLIALLGSLRRDRHRLRCITWDELRRTQRHTAATPT